ncbi:MAG: gliding motility-associated C-terminal domain-containing protein [Ferruginibacter sp.]
MKPFYLLLFINCSICFSANGQLCSGSLGKPVINIDFGKGPNPGPPLSTSVTGYQYSAQECYDDGIYSIRNSISNCPLRNWQVVYFDHTRNGSGYCMFINAAYQADLFYTDTAKNLCGNTTYELAAWFLNLNKSFTCNGNPIKPNISFSVSTTAGAVLQTYNTGDISTTTEPVWKQFGFLFTTPPNTGNIIFKMYNNAAGGCGNDFALDDITFRPCGPMLTVSVNGSASSISFCEGNANSYNLSCNISGNLNNPSYQWQQSTDSINYADIPGATAVNYIKNFAANALPGKYYYRMALLQNGQSVNCSVFSLPVVFRIDPLPFGVLSSNSPICEKAILQLLVTGDPVIFWTLPSGQTMSGNPLRLPGMNHALEGKYYVQLKAPSGCEKTDSVTVVMNPAPIAVVSFTDSTVCSAVPVNFQAWGGIDYLWSPSTRLNSSVLPDPVATAVDSTIFRVIVKNVYLCADTAYINLNTIKKPVVNAGPDRTVIIGTPVRINAQVTGNISGFNWISSAYLDDPFSLHPVVNPPAEMKFLLTAEAIRGCGMSLDTVNVKVFDDIYIPNVFTPNNDGRNDTWRIPSLDAYSGISVSVFSRYGQKVFETNNLQQGWDGKFKGEKLFGGNYIYMISIPGRQPIRGNLLLLR